MEKRKCFWLSVMFIISLAGTGCDGINKSSDDDDKEIEIPVTPGTLSWSITLPNECTDAYLHIINNFPDGNSIIDPINVYSTAIGGITQGQIELDEGIYIVRVNTEPSNYLSEPVFGRISVLSEQVTTFLYDLSDDLYGYKSFTDISSMKSWLDAQPENNQAESYKIRLSGIDLDATSTTYEGSNLKDLRNVLTSSSGNSKYVSLDIRDCYVTELIGSLWTVGNPSTKLSVGFNNCVYLTSIRLPHTLLSITDDAFSQCFSLYSVRIPNTVTSISDTSFCRDFRITYYIESGSCFSTDFSRKMLIKDNTILITGSSLSGDISIPNGIVIIGNNAFYDCDRILSIIFPSTVVSIGEQAFMDCESITSVTIPDSVKVIGNETFKNCVKLSTVIMSISLESLGNEAFAYCFELTEIELPTSVYNIGYMVFTNCTSLEKMTLYSLIPPILGEGSYYENISDFQNTPSSFRIYVPESSLALYKTTSNWSNHAGKMVGF